MALDHYVPQVHLRHWVSGNNGPLLNVIRKSDFFKFTPLPRNICAVPQGSTNRLLAEPRKIEETLAGIEPKYNKAVASLSRAEFDNETVWTIAGFAACIMVASPTALRLHNPTHTAILRDMAVMLDRRGLLPGSSGMRFSRHVASGATDFRVDGRFSQSILAENMNRTIGLLTHGDWEVLHNRFPDCPFFTSDYPIALEVSEDDRRLNNKVIPLTPNMALRIKPNIEVNHQDPPFTNLTVRRRALSRGEVKRINTLIVRSAEEVVVYLKEHNWVPDFVDRNRRYWIDGVVTKTRVSPRRVLYITRQQIVERPSRPAPNQELAGQNWFDITPAAIAAGQLDGNET
ncbi:MAG: DUF4238 domain-containing protein [Cyanobacteria bacterium SZAS TMP-1]|nr:DUF4238 domain-containing protein [Cyanobacteria bacterium SZAS TMP-1]